MNYEFGKTYEMKVCRIDRDSAGYDYMALEDNEGKEQRVYNILKSQFNELPYRIAVKLTYDYGDGRYRFRQDETIVLRAHYEIGKPYAFRVAAIEKDSHNSSYYNIEDDFAVQRYYFKGEPKYHIGDGCILELYSIDDKGFLHFKETKHDIPKNSDSACPIPQDSAEHYYVKYGPESINIEYKTTIVFPPDEKGQDNIDRQMWNIVKGITALMNANGGKMIIGVHDKTQEILGIEKDYQYLNTGSVDNYVGQYPQNDDGYKRKIANMVRYESGSYAGSLITMDIKSKGGKKYCVIDVKQADRPIWMRKNYLFQRQEASSEPLWGSEATNFIVSRMQQSVENNVGGVALDMTQLKQMFREVLNNQAPTVTLPDPPQKTIDYWVVWKDDGTWVRQRQQVNSGTCFWQEPVYKNMSVPILVYCYESGKVATMKWSEVRKGANLDNPQKVNWSKNEKPMKIFIADQNSYLGIHSVDYNGSEFVKLHSLAEFSCVKSSGSIGSAIIPDGIKIIEYKIVTNLYYNYVKDLTCPKNKRTMEAGTPTNSVPMKEQVAYFKGIKS